MKTCSCIQYLIFASIFLGNMLAYAQDSETLNLLEKLKGYMTVDDSRLFLARDKSYIILWKDTDDVIQKLIDIGSPDVAQFFLDNITWENLKSASSDDTNLQRSVRRRVLDSYFGKALLKMKGVPLHQCMDTLMRSEEGTVNALMLECVTGLIHSRDDFMREVESLIKTSPDPKRWQTMKERLENNIFLQLPESGQPTDDKTPKRKGDKDDGKATPKEDKPPQK